MSGKNISFGIDDCISELDFISSIPSKHKPCYKTKTTITKGGWFVTIRRRWNGEMGEYGIIHVNKVLGSCDLHYRMCLDKLVADKNYQPDKNYKESMKKLSAALKKSIIGFNNLIETYNDQEQIDYKTCKTKAVELSGKIDQYFERQKLIVNRDNESGDYEDYYTEDGEYIWGESVETDDPMVLSLFVSKDNSSKKSRFFNTDNVTFITLKKK